MRKLLFCTTLGGMLLSAWACGPRGHTAPQPVPLRLTEPVTPAQVAGCYTVQAGDGSPFQRSGYWSAGITLDSARVPAQFARDVGESVAFRARSAARGSHGDTPMFSTVWYVHAPDSLYVRRVGAFGGETMRLAFSHGAFAGEWSSADDVSTGAATRPVALRRVAC